MPVRDLVITDQAMPGMTGLDPARLIARSRPGLRVNLANVGRRRAAEHLGDALD
jgi:CheY-like chemotaxis protein